MICDSLALMVLLIYFQKWFLWVCPLNSIKSGNCKFLFCFFPLFLTALTIANKQKKNVVNCQFCQLVTVIDLGILLYSLSQTVLNNLYTDFYYPRMCSQKQVRVCICTFTFPQQKMANRICAYLDHGLSIYSQRSWVWSVETS